MEFKCNHLTCKCTPLQVYSDLSEFDACKYLWKVTTASPSNEELIHHLLAANKIYPQLVRHGPYFTHCVKSFPYQLFCDFIGDDALSVVEVKAIMFEKRRDLFEFGLARLRVTTSTVPSLLFEGAWHNCPPLLQHVLTVYTGMIYTNALIYQYTHEYVTSYIPDLLTEFNRRVVIQGDGQAPD